MYIYIKKSKITKIHNTFNSALPDILKFRQGKHKI